MVAQALPRMAGRKGWAVYLFLSLAANAYAAYAAGLGLAPSPPRDVPVLKISLSAVAAPPPAQQLAAAAIAALTPVEASPMPVETVAEAPVGVAVPVEAAPQAMTSLEPVPIETVAKPVEIAAVTPPREPLPEVEKRPELKTVSEPKADTATLAPPTSRTSRTPDKGSQSATVVHNANYRRRTPPVYPSRAVELGQQGTVLLHAEILPDGHPRELKVVRSSGHRLLDVAALTAVKGWQFEPTNIDGAPVTSWVRVPVNFVIQR